MVHTRVTTFSFFFFGLAHFHGLSLVMDSIQVKREKPYTMLLALALDGIWAGQKFWVS